MEFRLARLTYHKATRVTDSRKKKWGRREDEKGGNQEEMRHTLSLISVYFEGSVCGGPWNKVPQISTYTCPSPSRAVLS